LISPKNSASALSAPSGAGSFSSVPTALAQAPYDSMNIFARFSGGDSS
jgi:hypothetical protein